MSIAHSSFLNPGYLEVLSRQDTPIHRLEPRVKLLSTLAFIFTIVSFDRYELSGLVPFAAYPLLIIIMGDIPISRMLKMILPVAPFAIFVGILNPFFDREIMFMIGGIPVSGGIVSFFSIIFRFLLTAGSAFLLIATSGFLDLSLALERMKVPRAFVMQLIFLYRYIFVLHEETSRLLMARSVRSPERIGIDRKLAGHLIGHLMLRTLYRARRIYRAMQARGFEGEIRLLRVSFIGRNDVIFLFLSILCFIIMRRYNLAQIIGKLASGAFV